MMSESQNPETRASMNPPICQIVLAAAQRIAHDSGYPVLIALNPATGLHGCISPIEARNPQLQIVALAYPAGDLEYTFQGLFWGAGRLTDDQYAACQARAAEYDRSRSGRHSTSEELRAARPRR
jgi:hypothetical protein